MINSNLKLSENMNNLQRIVKNTGILFSAQIVTFILVLLCAIYEYYLGFECFVILSFVFSIALILSIFTKPDLNIISVQYDSQVWIHENLATFDDYEEYE